MFMAARLEFGDCENSESSLLSNNMGVVDKKDDFQSINIKKQLSLSQSNIFPIQR